MFLLAFIAKVASTSSDDFWYDFQGPSRNFTLRPDMSAAKFGESEISESDISALLKGDRASFRKIYDAYYNLAIYVCRRCGLPAQNIDEIVQDTFLKLFTNTATLKSTMTTSGQLKAWIATTSRNGAIDYIRRNKRLSFGDDAVKIADSSAYDPNEGAIARELEFKIASDFIQDVINEPGGDTFVLFYRDGKTAREIAADKNEAISTVTTRLTRLRRKFSETLKRRIESLRSGSLN